MGQTYLDLFLDMLGEKDYEVSEVSGSETWVTVTADPEEDCDPDEDPQERDCLLFVFYKGQLNNIE
jgi:hypothetical protein